MKKDEVWKARLPPAAGHAQAGERPAIIVQNDAYTARLPAALIVPLTGALGASRFAGTLVLQPDGKNGLTIPSVALVFQVRALDKRDLLQYLGAVDAPTMGQLSALLAALTG